VARRLCGHRSRARPLARGWSKRDAPAHEIEGTAKPSELLDPPRQADLPVGAEKFVILITGLAFEDDVEGGGVSGSVRVGVLDGRFELSGRG
jgi:hypothetical protein